MKKDINKRITDCLIQIQKNKNSESVERLYDLIHPTIRHIAWKYMHDQQLAEDLIQDFWADIYKIADGFHTHRNGFAYLCKVATNKAINRYHQIKDRNAHALYVDYSELPLSDQGLSAEQMQLRLAVEQAMAQLSDTERIIIQSTYFEQKTIRKIAQEMKLSKSTAERIKQQALAKLSKLLT